MNIVLLILKIIGIILLVILGIVLLVVGCVLFAPIRYQARGQIIEKDYRANVRVTWLLRLLSVEICFTGDGFGAQLKAARFRLKSFGSLEEKEHVKDPLEQPKMTDYGRDETDSERTTSDDINPQEDIRIETPEPVQETDWEKETENRQKIAPEKRVETSRESNREESENLQEAVRKEQKPEIPEENAPRERIPEITAPKETDAKTSGTDGKKKLSEIIADMIRRIADAVGGLPDKLLKLTETCLNFADEMAGSISGKADKAREKISAVQKKLESLITDDNIAVLKLVWQELLILLKHFRPRKIKGYLKYGTGRPDLTAQAGGLLYMFLPAGANRYVIDPVWDSVCIETDTVVSGRIRLCHALAAGVRLLLSKQFRKLVFGGRRKKERER